MLSSITPFGERARNQRYPVTAGWFIAGATVGGALLGGVLAAGASLVRSIGDGLPVAAGIVLVVAAVWDVAGRPVPGLARQVDEDWIGRFRGWVYGFGFGVQLGVGFATYVTSALVWGLAIAAIVSASPWAAFVAGVVFGATRGFLILLSSAASDPGGLRRLFSRLQVARRAATFSGAVAVVTVVAAWWVAS